MKPLLKLLILPILIVLLYLNLSFYYQAEFREGGLLNQSVYEQLQFLKEKSKAGIADSMQEVYPEGFVFFNAIYGLSWCDLIADLPPKHPIYKEGLKEIGLPSSFL